MVLQCCYEFPPLAILGPDTIVLPIVLHLDMVFDKQLFLLPAAGSFSEHLSFVFLPVVTIFSLLDDATFINYQYLLRRRSQM